MISSILFPYFVTAVERRANPTLAGKPLVISAADPTSDKVLTVSLEAARSGIKPGMSLRQARLRCPQVRLIPARPDRYQETLAEILDLLRPFTAKLETAEDQKHLLIYADFELQTGSVQLSLAQEINQTIREYTQLMLALGLAGGKFPASMAATAIGLNRTLVIAPGQERSFLSPFPIQRLPLDKKLARYFELLGLKTVGQLADLPRGAVLTQFGAQGQWLHRLAQGIDDRPIRPYPADAVEQAERHFDDPVADRTILTTVGQALLQTLSTRLQASRQVCGQLGIKLPLENGQTWTDQVVLRQPTADPPRLARVFNSLLERVRVTCGVMSVEISLADLKPIFGQQLSLFDEPLPAEQTQWLFELAARYGADRFFRPQVIAPTAYLPEHRFRLRDVEEG